MKFIVLLFWSLILGEVAGFIITKLNDADMQTGLIAIISLAFAVFIFLLSKVGLIAPAKAK
ncbi:DUF2929 family protein [Lactococcus insecticola]|uniref:DUF2929 domain-containing protein n=1 Tax=Pseudolactococcus insecticola TaxID=2709158 RepID=A0A6A0B5Z7_9LACT|nr:DUF2929 family protein [Lactococcus insecticola]GFH40113.1 hypothetical protein Hs20B_05110 [Lactococcus insecticola]